jgi:ABC-2 type transport system permease protein
MNTNYSQVKAMLAITKGSFKAQLKSPSALVFGFVFPLMFILMFGFMGGSGPSVRIAISKQSDTSNLMYAALKQIKNIVIVSKNESEIIEDLKRGRITAIVGIQKSNQTLPAYQIKVQSSTASVDKIQILQSILKSIIQQINEKVIPNQQSYISYETLPTMPGRIYRTIDFILPGQLGFSLLSAGLFGVSFLFFNLRETLVLKRFNATPIKRSYILLGEAIARIAVQIIIISVIILIGKYFMKFTLVNGWETFFELLILSFLGLLVFMGFGFFISGYAKNINVIPALTNVLGFPQILLAGTFFSVENFPSWLRPISAILPLTHLNDAMRLVAFEGAHIFDCGKQLGILGIWAIIVYSLAIKFFKWE